MTDQTIAAPKKKRRGRKPGATEKYARNLTAILDSATDLINERGVRGMTFSDIAQSSNLSTTSITYYFRKKELLAESVFEHGLEQLEAKVRAASAFPDPRARVAHFLQLHFEHHAKATRGEQRAIAILSEMRALDEEARYRLTKHYQSIFRQIRDFFGPMRNEEEKALHSARAHMLTEVIFWLPIWINQYSLSDFDRVQKRLFRVLEEGIAARGGEWAPELHDLDSIYDPSLDGASAPFLQAATLLINERGYRGASVDRIVSSLNVTKGSFYHHLNTKDDLVLECFRRSYHRLACAQKLADDAGGSQWRRLSSAIATLLNIQFSGEWPLMRTTALQALPQELRKSVTDRSNRIALRFGGIIVDGIQEGSIRPVDPLISSQVVMATLNAAYDIGGWARELPRQKAIALYASTLAYGLFCDKNSTRR